MPAAVLDAATDLLAQRGPDASGTRIVDLVDRPEVRWPYGIGHRRLSIQDLSESGAQPMTDGDGHALVYNGELYNSPALRRELEAAGHRFRGTSDTEVLLRGYVEWGDEVLSRIEGIFSFALVDEPKGRVLLARDRLGVKPLYWAQHEGALLAGSAPRSLIAIEPALRSEIDRVAIAQFLSLLWVPHPRTPWSAIHKLPPATALVFDGTKVRTWRYWDQPTPNAGREIIPAELHDTIARATTGQLLSDVPVGLLFSGGLDSSILLASWPTTTAAEASTPTPPEIGRASWSERG